MRRADPAPLPSTFLARQIENDPTIRTSTVTFRRSHQLALGAAVMADSIADAFSDILL
jgi:hypothetical protein